MYVYFLVRNHVVLNHFLLSNVFPSKVFSSGTLRTLFKNRLSIFDAITLYTPKGDRYILNDYGDSLVNLGPNLFYAPRREGVVLHFLE